MNWMICGVKGLRADVKAKIVDDSWQDPNLKPAPAPLPAEIKTVLLALVDGLPANCLGVKVDAYAQREMHPGGTENVTENLQITIVGIAL